jgi:hypothetical protein
VFECSGLTALPAGLGTLTGLRELDLSGCSGLTALPAELGALTGLQKLNLSDCPELTALEPATTGWRLFRHVREQIRDAAHKVPGLNPREMACYVDDYGTLATPFELSRLWRRNQEYIGFEFDVGGRKDVKRSHVLPSEDSEALLKLVPRIRCRGSARVFLGYRVASDLGLVKRLCHDSAMREWMCGGTSSVWKTGGAGRRALQTGCVAQTCWSPCCLVQL